MKGAIPSGPAVAKINKDFKKVSLKIRIIIEVSSKKVKINIYILIKRDVNGY